MKELTKKSLVATLAVCVSLMNIFYVQAVTLAETSETTEVVEITDMPELLSIGVTSASFDDVGQILRHFGHNVELTLLTHADMRSAERLQAFYAIFINCGSHGHFDARALNTFVKYGGVVYASDHAGSIINAAFPGVFELYKYNPAQVVSGAVVTHSTLSSHMRADYIGVLFDSSNWYSIVELCEYAIIYIEGELETGETKPLAVSFTYGEGQVFFTSFHNSAQATSHMINFIEYLVFRIKNVEADRSLQESAQRDGFVYRGAVFGGAGRAAMAMSPAPSPASAPGVAGSYMWEFDAAPESLPAFWPAGPAGQASPAAASPTATPPALWEEYFRYTFTGQGFMLMLSEGVSFEYVTLIDPSDNRFTIYSDGQVVTAVESDTAPDIVLEYSGGYRVIVRDIAVGEWRFAVQADGDAGVMIGIAVME